MNLNSEPMDISEMVDPRLLEGGPSRVSINTIPQTGERRVHPLSEQARNHAVATGVSNVNVAAEELSIRETPDAELTPELVEAKREMIEADERALRAGAKARAAIRKLRAIEEMELRVVEKGKDIALGQGRLEAAKAFVAKFNEKFVRWPETERQQGWPAVVALLNERTFCNEIIASMPAWLETAKAELARMQADLATLKGDAPAES